MFCRNCKTQLDQRAVACTGCGMAPRAGDRYCHRCGIETPSGAAFCPACGAALGRTGDIRGAADKKLVAGLTALLLSGLGVHKFILGYTTEGLIMLLVTLLTCGVGWLVMGPISIIEGIIYLTRSDEEFIATYIESRKGWF